MMRIILILLCLMVSGQIQAATHVLGRRTCRPLTDHPNLMVHWTFEGNLTGSGPLATNLSPEGGTPGYDSATPLEGTQSLSLGGSQAVYIANANLPAGFPMTGSVTTFSWAMRVRFDVSGNVGYILSKYATAIDERSLGVQQTESDTINILHGPPGGGSSGLEQESTTGTVSTGVDYAVIYTENGTTGAWQLFVYTTPGGVLVASLSGTWNNTFNVDGADFYIGGRDGSTFRHMGEIDDVMGFNAILTSDEIMQYVTMECTGVSSTPDPGGDGPTGITLLGGSDFNSGNFSLGNWANDGTYHIRPYTDSRLSGLPNAIAYFETLLYDTHTPIGAYCDIEMATIGGREALLMDVHDREHTPTTSRTVFRCLNPTASVYQNHFYTFKVYIDSANHDEFDQDTEAGGAWLSMATYTDDGNNTLMPRLWSGAGSDDGVYLIATFDEDVSPQAGCTFTLGIPDPPDATQHLYHVKNLVSNAEISPDTWHKVDVAVDASSIGGADGEFKMWLDGNLIIHVIGQVTNDLTPDGINYLKNYGNEIGVYFDDFWVYDSYTESGSGAYAGLGSPRGETLEFSTDFDSPVAITGGISGLTGIDDPYYSITMDGADQGYDLCAGVPGIKTGVYADCYLRTLLHTNATFSDYYEFTLPTMTGPLGTLERVFKVWAKDYRWNDETSNASRFQWNVGSTGSVAPDSLREFYFEYDMMLDPTWLAALSTGSSNYNMFWENSLPDNTNVHILISVDTTGAVNGGNPYWVLDWHVIGGGEPYPPITNTAVPVPIGQWATYGIYYKSSTSSDGRIYFWINDQQVFAYNGPTHPTSAIVGTVCPMKSYFYNHASYINFYANFEWYRTIR